MTREPAEHGGDARPTVPPEDDDAPATDARTSPFPYAEDFGAWVADETKTDDAPHPRREGESSAPG